MLTVYPKIIPLLHNGGLQDRRKLLKLRTSIVVLRGEVGGAWSVVNERGKDRSPSPSVIFANTSNE